MIIHIWRWSVMAFLALEMLLQSHAGAQSTAELPPLISDQAPLLPGAEPPLSFGEPRRVAPPPDETPLPQPGVETAYNLPGIGRVEMPAADPNPISYEPRTIQWEGETLPGYMAWPAAKGSDGAILMLPEWWGVNEPAQARARDLARQGYRVFVLDLFAGQLPASQPEASRAAHRLDREAARHQIRLALEWLAADRATTAPEMLADTPARPGRIGLVGYGFGASLALQAALELPEASPAAPGALVLAYGDPVNNPERLRALKCPILAFFSSHDGWITAPRIDAFGAALDEASVEHQFYTMDAQLGFALDPQGRGDVEYGRIALERTLDFLNRNLRRAP